MTAAPLVVYRGQLHTEWSRVSFVLESVREAFGGADLAYVAPRGATPEPEVRDALRELHDVRLVAYLQRGRARLAVNALALRRLARRYATTMALGTTSLHLLGVTGRRPTVWFVNGVPEERLLGRSTAVDRWIVRAVWRSAARFGPQDLVVVVSAPMAELVEERCRPRSVFVAPCCVDRTPFSQALSRPRRYVTYLGSGAAWQGLPRLAGIWAAMHRLDPDLRFRAISTDPAVARLGDALPAGVFEQRSAADLGEVADLLAEASLGCLLREPSLVNEVSYPMKAGEYLASGTPVAVTDIGWEVADLLRATGAGPVVRWSDDDASIAAELVGFLRSAPADLEARARAAGEALDRSRWVPALVDRLRSAHVAQRRAELVDQP